jgi:hypothetical protein
MTFNGALSSDSVGWGSPFLLVPEATSVDEETRNYWPKPKKKTCI